MTQLDMFQDTSNNGKRDLKPIDYTSPIGMYKEIAHVQGVHDLSDKAMELLFYLYTNHARPEDGFIHAGQLSAMLKLNDTRQLRTLSAEIDDKTELVVYSSQKGYKLASSEREIEMAIKFKLAPAMTSIKRVIAKAKILDNHKMLQGYIGNIAKLYEAVNDGQLAIDIDTDEELNPTGIREVSHYPAQPFVDYMPTVDERIEKHNETIDILFTRDILK